MVKFDDKGQGYFSFLETHASADFLGKVESALSSHNSFSDGTSSIFKVDYNSYSITVYITHGNEWFTILSELSFMSGGTMIYKDFVSL